MDLMAAAVVAASISLRDFILDRPAIVSWVTLAITAARTSMDGTVVKFWLGRGGKDGMAGSFDYCSENSSFPFGEIESSSPVVFLLATRESE